MLPQYVVVALKVENTVSGWLSSGKLVAPKGDNIQYIDDLKLHIFEMRYLPEGTRKLFRSDMRIVADFLAEGKEYRSDRKIVHKAALIKMIKVLSGDMDIEAVEDWMKE